MVLRPCQSTMGTDFILYFFIATGILCTIRFVIGLLYTFWSGFVTYVWSRIRSNVDFKTVHGPWAVITGSTDGIGKEFAKQLAKRGMNIVLISRNELKLKNTAEEIRNECDVAVSWIQADFTSTDVYSKIREGLENLDIGILINNVGISNHYREAISSQTETFFKSIVNVNILATVINTSIVLPKMIAKNRGMIVNVGSMTGSNPVKYAAMYSSTKVFINYFTEALSMELEGYNVTVKGLKAGPIETAMLAPTLGAFLHKYMPFMCPTAENYVKSALATLNTDVLFTCGYWGHSLNHFILYTLGGQYAVQKSGLIFSESDFIWKVEVKRLPSETHDVSQTSLTSVND